MQPHSQPRRRRLVLALSVLLVVLTLAMRQFIRQGALPRPRGRGDAPEPTVREFAVLGSYARLKLWADPPVAEEAVNRVAVDLRKVHNMLNLFDPKSELSRLNQAAVSAPCACSEPLWELLLTCRQAYKETEGAFDVSVGPLMKLWGFHRKQTTLPTAEEVQEALAAVGLDKIEFDDEKRTVRFTHPGTYLDMGGIAKGYALDRAVALTRACGVRRGLIDLGGNIFCLEEPPPGKVAYSIGIRNPFHRDALLGTVQIANSAVATSGNYEQFVKLEGKTIHHIVDPRTGQPVAEVASVTVITPRGVDSDVYSTAVFVGGEKLVKALRRSRRRTSVLHVGLDTKGKAEVRRYGWLWKEVADGT